MTFLTGAHLSEPDERDWLYHEGKLAMARPLFAGAGLVDWRPLWTPRVQCAQDCVAFTVAQQIELYSLLHDPTPVGLPSPLFIYQRAVREGLGGVFKDEGSSYRLCLKAAREALAAERDWNERPENVLLVPPGDLYSIAGIEAFYRIPNLDECVARKLPSPSAQVDDAMRRGFPVGCVMKVNRPYADMGARVWEGPLPPDGDGYWEGYHAQAIIVSGEGRKGLGSSWGADLGDRGIYWLSDAAFDQWCNEFWVIQAAPLDL